MILDTAARRLRDQGLDGLNIKGVAEDAGISHATLIHHFGSSAEMRDALAEKMTADLINDLIKALQAQAPTEQLVENVFAAISEGGHAKLIAWRVSEGRLDSDPLGQAKTLFERLLSHTEGKLASDIGERRRLIYLITTAALGAGLAGGVVQTMFGMSEEEVSGFPAWLSGRL
ncbi:MAG: TetR/AcrR family transcriptional regulator [Pseudomonadota bacterium]